MKLVFIFQKRMIIRILLIISFIIVNAGAHSMNFIKEKAGIIKQRVDKELQNRILESEAGMIHDREEGKNSHKIQYISNDYLNSTLGSPELHPQEDTNSKKKII